MIERMLLIVLIWILNWSNFHAIYLMNRSSGVYSGRLVHGRWSDHTLQCNHWWAFSGIGVSAAELWRLWQTSSGLADRSIRPFQGTGLHVCTCELIDMSEIYIHLKNDYKYYHLQVAWKCSILKFLTSWYYSTISIFLIHCFSIIIVVYFILLDMYPSFLQIFFVSKEHLLSTHWNL